MHPKNAILHITKYLIYFFTVDVIVFTKPAMEKTARDMSQKSIY